MIDHKVVRSFGDYLATLPGYERLLVIEMILARLRQNDPEYQQVMEADAEALANDPDIQRVMNNEDLPLDEVYGMPPVQETTHASG